MGPRKSKSEPVWKQVAEVHQQSIAVLMKNPVIIFLYFFSGLVEFLGLTALFLAHSAPFSGIVAPIIRRFWGERFLHYPDNFILLPKLQNYAHVVILTLLGLVITGMVIKKIEAWVMGGRHLSSLRAFGFAIKKYFALLAIWLPVYFIMRYLGRSVLPPLYSSPMGQFVIIFAVYMMVQTITAFLFPAIMISDKGFLGAVAEGLGLMFRNLYLVVMVMLVPVTFGVLISFAKSFTLFYVSVLPESVLAVLSIGIIVSLVVDMYVTSATTILFLKVRNS